MLSAIYNSKDNYAHHQCTLLHTGLYHTKTITKLESQTLLNPNRPTSERLGGSGKGRVYE